MESIAARESKPKDEIDNATLLDEYIKDAKIRELTIKTIINYKSCLRIFSEILAKPLTGVGIEDLRAFLQYLQDQEYRGRKSSTATISRYFSAIQSFYEFLEFEGYIEKNPVPKFRRRYLSYLRKRHFKENNSNRQLISVEAMRKLINSVLDPRDKAVITLLAKTGIRRNELINIDIDDIDWVEQRIQLKRTPKRTNCVVFFDDECGRILKRWMISRPNWIGEDNKAFFLNEQGGRLNRSGVYALVTKHAERIGLHDPRSRDAKKRFTPHCCRHWFTTWLLRNGMEREFVKEFRGDRRGEAIDIYHHIDEEELKKRYLANMPRLGL